VEEDPRGLFQDLFRRITRRAARRPYHAFTTAFDKEIPADLLGELLGALKTEDAATLDDGWRRVLADRQLPETVVEASDRILRACSAQDLADTVVTLLLDHSGSMRGEKILHVGSAVDRIQRLLTGLGIKVEVLGFTTSTWHGGKSRFEWIRRGRPADPGRLCDLLHIVHRDGDDARPLADDELRRMLRPDLLKENVDGEALTWAARRIRQRPERRRILVVISDGASVDDATLAVNPPDYLVKHLEQVIADIIASDDIVFTAVGVGDDIWPFYPYGAKAEDPARLTGEMLGLLERLLTRAPADA
jgi:cobaltochelatase CobT